MLPAVRYIQPCQMIIPAAGCRNCEAGNRRKRAAHNAATAKATELKPQSQGRFSVELCWVLGWAIVAVVAVFCELFADKWQNWYKWWNYIVWGRSRLMQLLCHKQRLWCCWWYSGAVGGSGRHVLLNSFRSLKVELQFTFK